MRDSVQPPQVRLRHLGEQVAEVRDNTIDLLGVVIVGQRIDLLLYLSEVLLAFLILGVETGPFGRVVRGRQMLLKVEVKETLNLDADLGNLDFEIACPGNQGIVVLLLSSQFRGQSLSDEVGVLKVGQQSAHDFVVDTPQAMMVVGI